VDVAAMSRFQTAKENQATMEGLASGAVDVVIGTHKLLNPRIRFKDLGLMIVDEEQRFGVEAKETLKAMPKRVKCLHALTAQSLVMGPGVNPLGDRVLSLVRRVFDPQVCRCAQPWTEASGQASQQENQ